MLHFVLKKEVDTWDWIVGSLAAFDPTKMTQIEQELSYTQIATVYGMKAYADSALPS